MFTWPQGGTEFDVYLNENDVPTKFNSKTTDEVETDLLGMTLLVKNDVKSVSVNMKLPFYVSRIYVERMNGDLICSVLEKGKWVLPGVV